jgi:hypothetical protein
MSILALAAASRATPWASRKNARHAFARLHGLNRIDWGGADDLDP